MGPRSPRDAVVWGEAKWWAAVITATNLNGGAGDGEPGISEQGARGGGRREVKGRRVKKEKLSVGGFYPPPPHFSSTLSLVWVCIMWWCVIGLWSHWSCTNRLAGETCQLAGLWRWMCVLSGLQMWDCVGKRFDGVKPVLMVNRWGQLTLS